MDIGLELASNLLDFFLHSELKYDGHFFFCFPVNWLACLFCVCETKSLEYTYVYLFIFQKYKHNISMMKYVP